jgi:hypothetical protein
MVMRELLTGMLCLNHNTLQTVDFYIVLLDSYTLRTVDLHRLVLDSGNYRLAVTGQNQLLTIYALLRVHSKMLTGMLSLTQDTQRTVELHTVLGSQCTINC